MCTFKRGRVCMCMYVCVCMPLAQPLSSPFSWPPLPLVPLVMPVPLLPPNSVRHDHNKNKCKQTHATVLATRTSSHRLTHKQIHIHSTQTCPHTFNTYAHTHTCSHLFPEFCFKICLCHLRLYRTVFATCRCAANQCGDKRQGGRQRQRGSQRDRQGISVC